MANIVNYYVIHSNYIVKPTKYNFKVLAITVNGLAYWKYFFNINTDRLRYKYWSISFIYFGVFGVVSIICQKV